MLVLTRKREEQVVLQLEDQTILIRVVSIDGGRVRLGFEAGKDVKIVRAELLRESVTTC